MSQVRLSVAMCTYNGSRYLPEQLQSIAAQDQLPIEMVVCDDESADDTVRLLMEFASQVPFPVHVEVNKERLGLAKNFEKAVGRCQGDIIVLADQDDVWKPQKLDRLARVFETHPDAVYAFSDADLVDSAGVPLGHTLWQALRFREAVSKFSGSGQLRILLKQNVVTGAAMAFRASLKDVILPIPSDWVHDHWIALLGSALFQGVPVPERLLMYRRHSAQLIGVGTGSLLQVCETSLTTTQDDCRRKVERFQQLLDRALSVSPGVPCPANRVQLLKQKEAHLLERACIRSTPGIPRILRVGREAVTGRYKRFSDSWRSAARDLWYSPPHHSEPGDLRIKG